MLKPGGLSLNIIPNKLGFDHGLKIHAGHKFFMTPEKVKALAEKHRYRFEGYYASPLPSLGNRFFVHNKWITHSIKS